MISELSIFTEKQILKSFCFLNLLLVNIKSKDNKTFRRYGCEHKKENLSFYKSFGNKKLTRQAFSVYHSITGLSVDYY